MAASLCAVAGWAALSLSEAVPSAASTYYASPTGLPSNNGSLTSPLDLATALSSQGPVRPGDTLWLLGGVYRRPASVDSHGDPVVYVSTLNGTAAAPIVVRQYPGQRATLDGNLAPSVPVLVVQSTYTWYWGFEITNSNPSRSSSRGTAIDSYGHHNRFINLIIHDAGNGVGFWATSQADDSEIYGSVISHVGWEASDRGHGHSIYVQNVNGVKRIVDNILFESFSFGIHAYTVNSRIDNLTMTGNIAFNHGNLSAGSGPKANILFAGDQVAQNPTVVGNYSYYPAGSGGRGLDVSLCNNGRIQSNYLAGGTPLRLGSCSSTNISGNTMFGPVSPSTIQSAYPSNTYGSTPTGVWVGIRPNAYEPGRANVVIYNWANAPAVSTSLAAAGIAAGDTYEIRDAQNYFGPVVFSGVYNGQATFPMAGLTAAPVVGSVPIQPGHTSAQFGAFVVRRISGGTPLPGATLQASPASITPGGSATLSWTTSGASSVVIDQGIGAVAASGSRTVTPAATTTYTLTATNASGPTTATAVVTVNAVVPPPNVPPTVSLTAPTGGSVFTPAAAVTVRATAGDTNGTVSRVDFFAGAQQIGSDTTNPYEVTWTAGPVGPYSLTAVAVDNQNASTTSTAVPVSVVAATGGGVNVALAASGATATASSSYTADYAPRAAIDGRRSGAIRGQLGTWEDATGALPDWFQVSFAAPSTINRVDVFSMQEAWSSPVEPTPTLTSGLAAENFEVQYLNGAAWVVVPGSQVVGNRLVWKQVSFTPITTSAIRIVVTKVAGGITRLTEVEAWTGGSAPPAPPTNTPPTVSLTAPSGGSVFAPAAAVTVKATAGDTNGTVARVEFFAGSQLIGTDTSNPYEVTWTTGGPGPYSLTAVAVDNQNASTTSTAVPVSVAAATGGGVNVALAASGATATASSTYTADYAPRAAIDGRRSGAVRGQLGTWEDASGAVPDWFQVSFAAPSTINRVNVFSMQQNWAAPVEPTSTLTSGLAAENFEVQYWNGTAWVVVPGSQVVGNTLVWKQLSFAPITTSAIRIVVTKVAGGITRLTEVEAWTP